MDNNDKDKSKYKKIDIPFDHTNADTGSTEWKIQVFKKVNSEDWIKWKLYYEESEMAMPLSLAPKRLNMVQNLLYREAQDIFDTMHANQPNNVTADNNVTQSLTEVMKHVFNNNKNAWRCQHNYMHYWLMFNKINFKMFATG